MVNKPGRRLKICLAASGGGHVRQLLDLEASWKNYDYVFVTEDTALGRSLSQTYRTRFITHFAAGQAKLGSPFKMLAGAWRGFWQSVQIVIAERPDIIVSTGAGAVFPIVLLGKLFGARIVIIESFARFDHPSLFCKNAAPLADDLIIQSQALSGVWPRAKVFDPLRILSTPRPPKEPLLFATVGATLPFDRLVRTVADAKAAGQIPETIILQVGEGGLKPDGTDAHETFPFDEVKAILRRADIVVCHGGTGSLITALREGCRVVALPRLFSLREHYDDHQLQITEAFAARGLLQIAHSPEEFSAALQRARQADPAIATTSPDQLIAYLNSTIEALAARKSLTL
jgi:UDP-N-acetylglucosamine--N-acetylmuramyl-(pentapeptide) pyrophosphoryl-undecaprenol N-acetylglucosamine transferase